MENQTEKQKASLLLFGCCWLMYMIVCMTKTNYAASIAYIVNAGIFNKTGAGTIAASFYFMYAVSQLFGGKITDLMSPFTAMTIGVVASIFTNFILAFTTNFYLVFILWSFTGFIQFGVWPSAARIVSSVLVPEHRGKAGLYITFAIGVGGILSYFVVNPMLEAWGWMSVFFLNVALLCSGLFFWLFAKSRTEKILLAEQTVPLQQKKLPKSEHKFMPLFMASGMIFILFFGIAQAMLDNGVKTWVPTMLDESYHISATFASIQTALLYICNIFGVLLVVHLFRKIKNTVLVQTLYFAICLPACFMMLFIGKIPLWLAVGLLVLSTTMIYGMTNLSVRIAAVFSKFGYSATVSGLINAMVCFGIVIGNMGYGYIAENYGWTAVTAIWLIICALAVILGIPATVMWKKFVKSIH